MNIEEASVVLSEINHQLSKKIYKVVQTYNVESTQGYLVDALRARLVHKLLRRTCTRENIRSE